MDFSLPEQTLALMGELDRWARSRRAAAPNEDLTADTAWKDLTAFGLLTLEEQGGSMIDVAASFMAASAAPLPGPLVEGHLAVATGSPEARQAVAAGQVVTSLAPGAGDPAAVGWGAVADLVVDQTSGSVLARTALPPMSNAFGLMHGWIARPDTGGTDELRARRWLVTSAVLTGLAQGAFELATDHVRSRELFGRTLSDFQAVQIRLAECLFLLRGARLAVLSAAWRSAESMEGATPAAAMSYLYATRMAEAVQRHSHQVFGALGFCTETGLFRYTSQMRWLRLSTPRQEAVATVMATRARRGGTPPSLVMKGFAHQQPE